MSTNPIKGPIPAIFELEAWRFLREQFSQGLVVPSSLRAVTCGMTPYGEHQATGGPEAWVGLESEESTDGDIERNSDKQNRQLSCYEGDTGISEKSSAYIYL